MFKLIYFLLFAFNCSLCYATLNLSFSLFFNKHSIFNICLLKKFLKSQFLLIHLMGYIPVNDRTPFNYNQNHGTFKQCKVSL